MAVIRVAPKYSGSKPIYRSSKPYGFFCQKCDKDTLHTMGVCVACKTEQVHPRQDEVLKRNRKYFAVASSLSKEKKGTWNTMDQRQAAASRMIRRELQLKMDKKKALHEAAERSREMFEGKKQST